PPKLKPMPTRAAAAARATATVTEAETAARGAGSQGLVCRARQAWVRAALADHWRASARPGHWSQTPAPAPCPADPWAWARLIGPVPPLVARPRWVRLRPLVSAAHGPESGPGPGR